jgi:Mce-associated membrane protein
VVVVLVVLALAGLAGERAYTWKNLHDDEEARRAAVAAASAEVRGLLSISATTSDEDVAALLAGATADFRSELESQADRLRTELSENDVVATGSIDSAAVSAFGGDSATVIMAASGTVDNKQTADPEPRNYRLEVTLVEEDGRWLVSGLEFVA